MKKKLFFIILLFAAVILAGCNNSSVSDSKKGKSAPGSKIEKQEGVTALKAWEKIKPEADKWSKNYRIARIQDSSYAGFQRQDGLGNVWEFALEDCEKMHTSINICSKGKTRTFLFSTTKGGWGPKGVSAKAESSMVSGRAPFSPGKMKIDTDEAVKIARKKAGQPANEYEEFIIQAFATDEGAPYWEVSRQCWGKRGNREACSNDDNYVVYVNIETGEASAQKPR